MTVLTVIIVIISVLLIALVLVQKAKGGGLAAQFQSSNQVMGAPKTADFLEKATWTLMGVVAVFCICCTLILGNSGNSVKASAIEAMEGTAAPTLPEAVSEDAPAADAPAAEAPVENAE